MCRERPSAARSIFSHRSRPPPGRREGSQKSPDEIEKGRQLVVVDPVAGTVERNHTGISEMAQTTVGLGVRRPALLAVNKQGGTGDARPELLDLGLRHAIGRIGARVIVEFPAVGAILVLIDTMLRQMARLLGREMPVGLLHAPQRVLDRGVAAR